MVSDCNVKHNILLHSWADQALNCTATQPSVNCASTDGAKVKNCLGIKPVVVKGKNGNSCTTYALIDDGADKTLFDERLLRTIEVDSKPISYQISTVNSTGTWNSGRQVNLKVQSMTADREIYLQNVWSVKQLPISTRSAATPEDRRFQYLADLDIPHVDATDVMLLIRTDCPGVHIPQEVRSGDNNQPYAIRTQLGWIVRGPVHGVDTVDCVNINFQQSSDLLLQQKLERMWNADKMRGEKTSLSIEDKHALQTMETPITFEDGHYKIGLPWQDDSCILPNNMALTHARLEQLRKKLLRDPELRQMYTDTVGDYIQRGYAKKLTDETDTSKRIW